MRGGADREAAPPRRIDLWLGGFAAATLGVSAAGVALGMVLMGRAPAPAPDVVAVEVGGERLAVPGRWLRSSAPGWTSLVVPAADLGLAAEAGPIPVHLQPADGPDPAGRTALLYARFLSPEASAADGDLVRREFRVGTPFEGETLLLAPPDGRSFAARCARAVSGGQAECAAAFRVRGVDVGVGLPAALVAEGPGIVARLARGLGAP